MAEVCKVLREARAVIEKPERWQKGWFAKTAQGFEVYGNDPDAVCFCALGAVQKVTGSEALSGADEVCAALALAAGDRYSVHNFNDDPDTTHADVLGVFDKAIKASCG